MRTINSLDPSQKAALESVVNGQSDSMVIYGPPGTGKSHLARELAAHYGLPLFSKDDFKEILFDEIVKF